MKVIYAVGDIHGHNEKLEDISNQILEHSKNFTEKKIVFLGDYIDRGPSSKNVLETLSDPNFMSEFDKVFLEGNHDNFMKVWLEGENFNYAEGQYFNNESMWLGNGGIEFFKSYDMDIPVDNPRSYISERHKDFILNRLELCHFDDGYVFAHADYNPFVSHESQDPSFLMWSRKRMMDYRDEKDFPFKLVCGHTPTRTKRVVIGDNIINVDGGSCFGGKLCAVALYNGEIETFEDNCVYD